MKNKIPQTIYHYCSVETFFALIQSNCIRQTNISKSNDKMEIKFCSDVFERSLKESYIQFIKNNNASEELVKYIYDINYANLVEQSVLNPSLFLYYLFLCRKRLA